MMKEKNEKVNSGQIHRMNLKLIQAVELGSNFNLYYDSEIAFDFKASVANETDCLAILI